MNECKVVSLAAAAVIGMAGLAAPPIANAQYKGQAVKPEQLIGAWTLMKQYVEQEGKKVERFGPNPKGMTIFDAGGRFVSVLKRPDIPKVASNNAMTATAEENKAIVQGSTAFYGRWTVDAEGVLTSRVEGATYPNWEGLEQKRVVKISGDEMLSCVPGAQIGGTACAIWKRAK